MAERIQLSRRRGWRIPEGAVKVDRTSKWGNPFRVDGKKLVILGSPSKLSFPSTEVATHHAVQLFRWAIENDSVLLDITAGEIRAELAGKTLACWCPSDAECHADVLLEIANGDPS